MSTSLDRCYATSELTRDSAGPGSLCSSTVTWCKSLLCFHRGHLKGSANVTHISPEMRPQTFGKYWDPDRARAS